MAYQITDHAIGVWPIPISANSSQLPDGYKLPPKLIPYNGFDPVFNGAKFVLANGVASLQVGDVVQINTFTGATTRTVAATRGLVGVSMAANTDTTALSWFQIYGTAVVRVTAATAGLAAYLTATAGSVASTVTAAQLVAGAYFSLGTAATVTTKTVDLVNGSTNAKVNNIDGLWVGATITSTSIPAATTITAIGYGGLFTGVSGPRSYEITLSAAPTATASEAATITTGTAFALASIAMPVANGLG